MGPSRRQESPECLGHCADEKEATVRRCQTGLGEVLGAGQVKGFVGALGMIRVPRGTLIPALIQMCS
eukprot:5979485-Alexandrium_andersonii.AAC.1